MSSPATSTDAAQPHTPVAAAAAAASDDDALLQQIRAQRGSAATATRVRAVDAIRARLLSPLPSASASASASASFLTPESASDAQSHRAASSSTSSAATPSAAPAAAPLAATMTASPVAALSTPLAPLPAPGDESTPTLASTAASSASASASASAHETPGAAAACASAASPALSSASPSASPWRLNDGIDVRVWRMFLPPLAQAAASANTMLSGAALKLIGDVVVDASRDPEWLSGDGAAPAFLNALLLALGDAKSSRREPALRLMLFAAENVLPLGAALRLAADGARNRVAAVRAHMLAGVVPRILERVAAAPPDAAHGEALGELSRFVRLCAKDRYEAVRTAAQTLLERFGAVLPAVAEPATSFGGRRGRPFQRRAAHTSASSSSSSSPSPDVRVSYAMPVEYQAVDWHGQWTAMSDDLASIEAHRVSDVQALGADRPAAVVAFSAACLLHGDSSNHPEQPFRVASAVHHLVQTGIGARCGWIDGSSVDDSRVETALGLVHVPTHVERIAVLSDERPDDPDGVARNPDLYVCSQTTQSVRAALRATLAAMDCARTGVPTFALVRPPGHHCSQSKMSGFCFANNVAVAIRDAQHRGTLGRVAIVDWDVHHGNGTQAIFEEDPSVLFISVHRGTPDFYPQSGYANEIGAGAGVGYTINIPLTAVRADDADYAHVFASVVLPALRAFRPELIVTSAGFDAAVGDPLGGMCVTPAGFASMCASLHAVAREHCDGRMLLVLEGGYNPRAIACGVAACIGAILDGADADAVAAGAEAAARGPSAQTSADVLAVRAAHAASPLAWALHE